MTRACASCQTAFDCTDEDRAFYSKIGVPPPTRCPACRLQRRMAWRNERYLFKRNCDLCKKEIITFFTPDSTFPIYCPDCWWSDRWDPISYGREFDFTRPFFEQFAELQRAVPKISLLQFGVENSDYNSFTAYCKNMYMSPGSYFSEDSYYVRKSQRCKDCLNSLILDSCELVAWSVNAVNCYNSHHLINCRGCHDSAYLTDSIGCSDCFMCAGVSYKHYCIRNKQYTKEDYQKQLTEELKKSPALLTEEFHAFARTQPKKYQNQINCENSSGDYIQNCKNARECYDSIDVEDSKYLVECVKVKDSMDLTCHDEHIELCYEIITGGGDSRETKFSYCAVYSPACEYVYVCNKLSDSFGCDGINTRHQYCCLNKQYTKEQYTELKKRIVAHMRATKEYGEFFPMENSLMPYNLSIAQDYFPLTKEQAVPKGYRWFDEDQKEYLPPTAKVPVRISDTPDTIIDELLACETCGKNYKVIAQELSLSRRLGIPVALLCASCRQMLLNSWKNPRQLWDRTCAKCGISIETTYESTRPEIVYCEQCYLKAVY